MARKDIKVTFKLIRVKTTTWNEIDKIRMKGESFDKFLTRMLEHEWNNIDRTNQERVENDTIKEDHDDSGSTESFGF